MTTLTAPDEFDLFSRVVRPEQPTLSADAARSLLSLTFSEEDVARMNELSAKARAGHLAPIEQQELDSYERVGHMIGILQSKARISLRQSADA
ncbi:MAG: hypothetical protein IT428_08220 [Planctomycetaceae bacterium]|nr:hypothetical protein [Planctomycetaceae bacterium]